MADKTLLMMLDDVRNKTLHELEGLDLVHARWAPPGLQNSCLWHAGHAFVVTEFLTHKALGLEPSIPDGWMKMFSWESNPGHVTPGQWPSLDEVVVALKQQHQRLRALIEGLTPEQLDAAEPANPNKTARYGIMHGLHDEARHSGEISLLRKMMRKSFVVES